MPSLSLSVFGEGRTCCVLALQTLWLSTDWAIAQRSLTCGRLSTTVSGFWLQMEAVSKCALIWRALAPSLSNFYLCLLWFAINEFLAFAPKTQFLSMCGRGNEQLRLFELVLGMRYFTLLIFDCSGRCSVRFTLTWLIDSSVSVHLSLESKKDVLHAHTCSVPGG